MKNSRLNVRLPSAELELWHRHAAARGISLSDWIVRLATAELSASERVVAPGPDPNPMVIAIPPSIASAVARVAGRAEMSPSEWALRVIDGALRAELPVDAAIQRALSLIGRPQHPEHVAAAAELLTPPASTEEALWGRYSRSSAASEVWLIASSAWHLARHG